jgi:hypothetical protein
MAKNSKIHWMSWDKMRRSKAVGGLGFRDLILFNNALLVKQGWRLIQEPSFITTLILKAKYFPNSSFFEASLGSWPSFAWRSIFNSRDLLQQGPMWRVGDGSFIKLWGDRWLPTPTMYTVQSPSRIFHCCSFDRSRFEGPEFRPNQGNVLRR